MHYPGNSRCQNLGRPLHKPVQKEGGKCQFLMPTSWDAAPEGQQTFKWVPSPQGTHGTNAKWGRGQKSHHR